MTRLAVLLRDHSGPIEADLERFYRRDLLDFHRGQMTVRKLSVLVWNLPPGAALWRTLGVDQAWTAGEHILRMIANNTGAETEYLPTPAEQHAQAVAEQRSVDRTQAHALRAAARQKRQREASGGD